MMLPTFVAACLIFAAGAQTEKPGLLDQGISWARTAWGTVQKEGRPAAERFVRQFPERFKSVPKRISAMQRRFSKDLKLEEKRAMLQELWAVRQSLNVMALLDPELLQNLTGIDAKMLRAAQQQLAALTARLR